jgi:hypothetical protein
VERKRFRLRIDVVEDQIDDAAVVAANSAAASRFLDENPFDLLLTSGDGLADTPLAAPASTPFVSSRVIRELGLSVVFADPDLDRAGAVR